MPRRSRSLLKFILPPPFMKAVVAIVLGAIVITFILYISGGADLILGQVFRSTGLRSTECASNDRACIQQLEARNRVSNLCNRGDRDCTFAQLNAYARETGFCSGSIECIQKQTDLIAGAVTPRPIATPQPRANQRSAIPGYPFFIHVQGRYDGTSASRLYPKAVMFCQSPSSSGLRNYLQSKLAALFGNRSSTGEWQNVAVQSGSKFVFPTPSTILSTPRLFSNFFRSTPLPSVPATTTSTPEVFCSAPRCSADQTLICPSTARNGCGCYCGTATTSTFTPPAPYGTRAADGCWYFPPAKDLGNSHSFTVPTDAVAGEATIKMLEGRLQSDQLEKLSTYTVETVFVQGNTQSQSTPADVQIISAGGSIERPSSNPGAFGCTGGQVVRAEICQGHSSAAIASQPSTNKQCTPVTVTRLPAKFSRLTLPSTLANGYTGHITGYNESGRACLFQKVTIGTPPRPSPATIGGSSITVKRGGLFEKTASEMQRSNPSCVDTRVVWGLICPGYGVANQCDHVSVSGSSASTARFTLPADYPDGINANVIGYNEAGVVCSTTRINIPRGSYPVPR